MRVRKEKIVGEKITMKPKLALVDDSFVPTPESNVFTLGNREFTVVPFAEWPEELGEQAYNDASEFLLYALPVVMKLMNLQATVAEYGSVSVTELSNGGQELTARDTVSLINELDIPSVVRELKDTLPKLVAISCHANDPRITSKDVMALVRKPTNPNLIRAVLLQIKADKIIEDLMESRNIINEFGTLTS